MRIPVRSRLLWVVLAAVILFAPFVFIGFPPETGMTERTVVILVSLLGVGLVFRKYAMVRAIRLDEQGIVLERRLAPDLVFPWRGTRISYHKAQRRAAEGLMIESVREDGIDREPYFFSLREVEESEPLLAALRERLGPRFREEEEA